MGVKYENPLILSKSKASAIFQIFDKKHIIKGIDEFVRYCCGLMRRKERVDIVCNLPVMFSASKSVLK